MQGILNPVRIFPLFVSKMEETISSFPVDDFVRKVLDDGYRRLVNVIFRNLNSAVSLDDNNNNANNNNYNNNDLEEKEQQNFDVINIGNKF